MSKFRFIWLLVFGVFLFFVPKEVLAAVDYCRQGMIEQIQYELLLEDGTRESVTFTENGPQQTIYKENKNFYLDKEKTKKIKDVGTITLKHPQSFLDQIALNNNIILEKNITYYSAGACENENRSLKTIKNKQGEWSFNYSSIINDMQCVFDNQFTLELRDPLKSGDNLICSRSYVYSTEAINSTNQCRITMEPSAGATIDNAITISAIDINDDGVGIRSYLNNEDISPVLFKTSDSPGSDAPSFGQAFGPAKVDLVENSKGLLDLTFPLGTLSVGNYNFEIKYEDGDKAGQNICVLTFSVVASGADPTPAQQVDADAADSFQLETETTVPLCKSIPAGSMCGSKNCQEECIKCENDQKIWTGIGCIRPNISGIVESLFNTFSGIMGALVFFCLVSNGMRIMASRGNPETLKKSQEAMTACLVGFVVLVLSVLFLKIVGVNILQLPGWT